MAFHHVVLFCTIIFLWYMFANAQESLDKKNTYYIADRTRHLFMPAVKTRALQNMELLSARSFGKRASDCFGGLCAKRIPEFSGARLYGKRDIDINRLKCLFVDCEAMENRMRNMDFTSD